MLIPAQFQPRPWGQPGLCPRGIHKHQISTQRVTSDGVCSIHDTPTWGQARGGPGARHWGCSGPNNRASAFLKVPAAWERQMTRWLQIEEVTALTGWLRRHRGTRRRARKPPLLSDRTAGNGAPARGLHLGFAFQPRSRSRFVRGTSRCSSRCSRICVPDRRSQPAHCFYAQGPCSPHHWSRAWLASEPPGECQTLLPGPHLSPVRGRDPGSESFKSLLDGSSVRPRLGAPARTSSF